MNQLVIYIPAVFLNRNVGIDIAKYVYSLAPLN